MRILLAARRYPPDRWSGTETVFQNLYERARRRHEVRLVAGFVQGRAFVPPEAVAVDLVGQGRAAGWARMAKAIFEESRRFRPDVILSNSIEVPPTGCPAACIIHDLNFGARRLSDFEVRLRRRFYAHQAGRLDAVITVSQATAQALGELGVGADKVRVIHNGVDTALFHPPASPRPPSDTVHFVYPSRILPGKGQHLAIDAIARLKREHKKRARLTLVGSVVDPVYLDQLRVQAWKQPVDFALDVPDIAPWYREADVVLFPTVMEEGFGFTAVDAMASGVPVIWFDQPAVREATAGIGLAVPREDVDELRAAMMRLMDEPETRTRIGQEGLRYVRNNLSWERVWEQYEAVLGAIARR